MRKGDPEKHASTPIFFFPCDYRDHVHARAICTVQLRKPCNHYKLYSHTGRAAGPCVGTGAGTCFVNGNLASSLLSRLILQNNQSPINAHGRPARNGSWRPLAYKHRHGLCATRVHNGPTAL